MNMKTESFLKTMALVIAGVLIGVTANINAEDWANPTATPPNGNVAAPINTSANIQGKMGGLSLGKDFPSDGFKLDVDGSAIIESLGVFNLVVATGSPAAGKVLASVDDVGTVGWQPLSTTALPDETNYYLETHYMPKPCPAKIMNQDGSVYTTNYSGGKTAGDVGSDSACGKGRLYADRYRDEKAVHAFCQSIGYQAYISGDFTDFSSDSNNKVIKYNPDATTESKFYFERADLPGNNDVVDELTCYRIVKVPSYPL